VLPPITAFDHQSREAPVYNLNRPSQYQYLPYPPQVPSSSSIEPRATYQPGVPNYQASRQIWPSQQYALPQQARGPPQDHNLLLAQQPQERSNFKEVKRRTKTGCQTCRKRRIKVSASMREITAASESRILFPCCMLCHPYLEPSHIVPPVPIPGVLVKLRRGLKPVKPYFARSALPANHQLPQPRFLQRHQSIPNTAARPPIPMQIPLLTLNSR
jgi:hypothetical protein